MAIKNGSVMPVHVECAKCIFNVVALLFKNCSVFSIGHRYSNTTCFPFLLTETPHQESILLILFQFSDNIVILVNVV